MPALSNVWKHAAQLSEDEIPADELAQLDPAAYNRLLERKAAKQADQAYFDSEDRRHKAEKEERLHEEIAMQEAMQLRAEQWGRQKTMYGGRETTEAEAQEARQFGLDHRDQIAAWARQHGYFKTQGDEDRYFDNERRIKDLKDAEQRARAKGEALPAPEAADLARMQKEQAPMTPVQEHTNNLMVATMSNEVASIRVGPGSMSALPPTAASRDDHPFRQKAPDLTASFTAQVDSIQSPAAPTRQPYNRPSIAISAMGGLGD